MVSMTSRKSFFHKTLTCLLVCTCRMILCDAINPSIYEGPVDQVVVPGATVELTCLIGGDKTSDFLVAWMKNGRRISRGNNESLDSQHVDTSRYKLEGTWSDGDYTLTITNIITADEGEFRCAIDSSTGTRVGISDPATVTVEIAPAEDTLRCFPTDFEGLRVGYPYEFTCVSDVGNPPGTLSWETDLPSLNVSRNIEPGRTTITFTRYIEVEDMEREFRCNLAQKLLTGGRSCVVGPLGVIYRPREVVITSDQTGIFQPNDGSEAVIDAGTHVFFSCEAQGSPEPNITWTVTEAPGCSRVQDFHSSRGVISLTKVTMAYDGATIKCTAENTVGTSSASFRIRVRSDDPNAVCYTTSPKPTTLLSVTRQRPTKGPVTVPASSLTSLHIIIIVIAVAFLIIVAILGYIAITRRREPIVIIGGGNGDDTRSIAESCIFRHETPLPEHRGNSLSRMQSNFSTLSYDTQSIHSGTNLMHLKSLESPEYKVNPKLTGSPVRKAKCCAGKDLQCDEEESGQRMVAENVYEGSPRRNKPATPTPKSALARQPSEHKYEVCPPLKKYVTHASQTDLTIVGSAVDEKDEEDLMRYSTSDSDDDFDYNPPKQNFSVNNSNIRYLKHTEV